MHSSSLVNIHPDSEDGAQNKDGNCEPYIPNMHYVLYSGTQLILIVISKHAR